MRFLLVLSALLLLSSQAASGADFSEDDSWSENSISDADLYADPWEDVNRSVFDFNLTVDRNILRPVSNAYGELPQDFRDATNNILVNLSEPVNVVHGILQLNPKSTLTSFWRFAINSTVGLAGIRDVASKQGLTYQNQKFANTFHRWGFSSGNYVVVPVFGPSSVRGTVGLVADVATDPFTLFASTPVTIARGSADAINERFRMNLIVNDLYYESLDPYGKTRSVYRQNETFSDQKVENLFD